MRKTCPKKERLQIDNEIIKLSGIVLSKRTINFIEQLSADLVSSNIKKEKAIKLIINLIPKYPKRPLYYLRRELKYLPHWTRDSVKYLGDYIDYLERKALKTYIKDEYKKGLSPSLLLKKLKPFIKESLFIQLKTYDRLFWRPSKHDFEVDETKRKHRFTTKEVVYCVFITIKLSYMIKKFSRIQIDIDPNTYFTDKKPGDYIIEPD